MENNKPIEQYMSETFIALAVLFLGWGLTYLDFILNGFMGVHDSVQFILGQALVFAGYIMTGKIYIDYRLLKR